MHRGQSFFKKNFYFQRNYKICYETIKKYEQNKRIDLAPAASTHFFYVAYTYNSILIVNKICFNNFFFVRRDAFSL